MKEKIKKKKLKLYDGYITINQDPTRAFDSDILHLRKNRTKKTQLKKEYYYLDTINFELLGQKTDKTINLNSGVLSDETLGKVLKDIENHLKKTNKELM